MCSCRTWCEAFNTILFGTSFSVQFIQTRFNSIIDPRGTSGVLWNSMSKCINQTYSRDVAPVVSAVGILVDLRVNNVSFVPLSPSVRLPCLWVPNTNPMNCGCTFLSRLLRSGTLGVFGCRLDASVLIECSMRSGTRRCEPVREHWMGVVKLGCATTGTRTVHVYLLLKIISELFTVYLNRYKYTCITTTCTTRATRTY